MRIRLSVVRPDPPCGTATVDGGEPRPFEGWLGLMGLLSHLLAEAPAAGEGQTIVLEDGVDGEAMSEGGQR